VCACACVFLCQPRAPEYHFAQNVTDFLVHEVAALYLVAVARDRLYTQISAHAYTHM